LVAAQRRQRVAGGIAGDDVRMDINGGRWHGPSMALMRGGATRESGRAVLRRAMGRHRKAASRQRTRYGFDKYARKILSPMSCLPILGARRFPPRTENVCPLSPSPPGIS